MNGYQKANPARKCVHRNRVVLQTGTSLMKCSKRNDIDSKGTLNQYALNAATSMN